MKKKDIKLTKATLAYNRFETNENVKVQLLDWENNYKILAEIFIPKVAFSKSWEELNTIIRFRLRRDFGYVLPKNCSYLSQTK